MKSADHLYLGIDVGTGSARAGLFDAQGRMHGAGAQEIAIHRPQADFAEQSSDDIWRACSEAVRRALSEASANPEQVKGIGFDATCSLVVVDESGDPVTVSPTGDDQWNIILWMDHRAVDQARRINATGHGVLRYVGGTISPEMETPKLLWLRENMPDTWRRAWHFFDLPDWLIHRATGSLTRSVCSLACKWTYRADGWGEYSEDIEGWDASHFEAIGLGELATEGYGRIGTKVWAPGDHAGSLNQKAAREMGLPRGVPVSVSMIDAHAGGLGVIGAAIGGESVTREDLNRRLALIGGTSSCHMACAPEPRFIPGVWGPYRSAMIANLWLNEGGQSATGALIDHVIESHAQAADLRTEATASGKTVYDLLNERLRKLGARALFPAALTRELHVLPYFHGNRSPRADPTLRGVVSGLRLDDSVDALALLYLATIQAIAHGTRHIIDEMNAKGYAIDTITACGGGTKNPVFLREHADVTGCRVVLPREPEAVLLGSAMLGAMALGTFDSDLEAMGAMSAAGEVIEPAGGDVARFHEAKHAVFLRMCDDQLAIRRLMENG